MVKKITEKNMNESQVQYLGRWVDKNKFRVFVYSEMNEEKLANSYEEFQDLIDSGLWYETRELASKDRKQKNGTLRSTS